MSALRLPPRRTEASSADKDLTIQRTDIDASASRLSAVETGYLNDPFASLLYPPHEPKPTRRLPLINRGSYTRTSSIDYLLYRFLQQPCSIKRQIISLGAGSDTRLFRFLTQEPYSSVCFKDTIAYHEFDFEAVSRRKKDVILADASLKGIVGGEDLKSVEDDETCILASPYYSLHSLDLRTVPQKPEGWIPTGVDPSLPTAIISECCLIYLSPASADGITKWLSSIFPSAGLILYEPIGGEDAFGQVMIRNLATRGIELKTLKRYSTLERQVERFKMSGFKEGQAALDVLELWNRKLWGEEELKRVSRLEFLDEMEEWELLAKHYCVGWGWKGEGWECWRDIGSKN